MKRVVAFGTFDVVHLGHIAYLRTARRRGDHLTVVVARDSTAANLKGSKPHFSQRERVQFLKELRRVDSVVLGNEGDRIEILRTLRPDVIVLGHDHAIDIPTLKKRLRACGVTPLPRIVRARAYRRSRYTSHSLKALNYETRRGYCFVGAVRTPMAIGGARGIRQPADTRPRQTRTRGRVS